MFLHILRIVPRPSRCLSLRSPSFLTKDPLRLGPPDFAEWAALGGLSPLR